MNLPSEEIERVVTDNDWDGLSAALQVLRHFPDLELFIDTTKSPSSTRLDLVLDLQTSGDGWVIDHHPRPCTPQRPFIYRPEGYPCTSRLVTEWLETDHWLDLFFSATAEIVEGVPHPEDGYKSLQQLRDVAPWLFVQTQYVSQHDRRELVYLLADLLAVACQHDVNQVPELVAAAVHQGMTVDSFINCAQEGMQEKLWGYTIFMRDFSVPNMPEVQIDGHAFQLTSHDQDWAPFSPQALDRIQLRRPGVQLIMFRERGLCVRTTNPDIIATAAERLGDIVGGYGGRGDRWALGCRRPLTSDDHKKVFDP